MSELPAHDREALLEQAARKESLASDLRCPRDPSWREHLMDAAEAYERAGFPEKAAEVRAALPTPPATDGKAGEEAPQEPQQPPEPTPKASRRSGR